ncbi:MAG: hypothetical protein KJ893_09680 [Candidatus Omnitrophica bacterium]|nr:hypothetical protein [Candidatus Omnitrophota bacterium]MBU4479251.1 hypothetical protein [Candidatus Omnitrophota bacterium]MCG2703073.1 hypothetical protein [Candidatus Omnitrophota bacterium]
MHLVNLLPEEQHVRKSGPLLMISPEIARLIFAAVAITVFLGAWWLVLKLKIDETREKLSEIEVSWKAAEVLVKERTELIEQKEKAEKTVVFLHQFLSRDIVWSEKFKRLALLTPPEIWFMELALEKEDIRGQDKAVSKRFLQLVANVGFLGTDDEMLSKINKFIENIKKDSFFEKNFEDLSMLNLRKDDKAGQQVINFKIRIDLEK